MKFLRYLLPVFALGAVSAPIYPSRYHHNVGKDLLDGSSDKSTRWLTIQEPGQHVYQAEDDYSPRSNKVMKRKVDDVNPNQNPSTERIRPGRYPDAAYVKQWRAERLKKINDPETPPEERARLQRQIEKEKESARKLNRHISLEEAERVLNADEMEEFKERREAHLRFRAANRALKKTMQKIRMGDRPPLTQAEEKEWEEILAGERAYAAISRKVASVILWRELNEHEAQSPSPDTKAQKPQASTEAKQRIEQQTPPPETESQASIKKIQQGQAQTPPPEPKVHHQPPMPIKKTQQGQAQTPPPEPKVHQRPRPIKKNQQGQNGGPPSDINPFNLNNPLVDAVQKMKSTLGESSLVKAIQRAASAAHRAGSQPVFPNIHPVLPVRRPGLI